MRIDRFFPVSLLVLFLALSAGCGSGGGRPTGNPGDFGPLTGTEGTGPALNLEGVYIPPNCDGQEISRYTPTGTPIADPQPNPAIATQDQLTVFDELAGTVNDFYLYPDFNGIDWFNIVKSYRVQVESGLETEPFYAKMGDLVSELHDEHSHFESPVEVATSTAALSGANDYVGIGVLVKPLLNKNSLTILTDFPDSAAEHGGLKPHDSILAVEGVPVVENGSAYLERVRGPECSASVLTVQSPGEAPREVTLVRYAVTSGIPIVADTVNADTADYSAVTSRPLSLLPDPGYNGLRKET